MHDVFDWYRAFEAYFTRVTLHTGLQTAVSFHSPQSALESGSDVEIATVIDQNPDHCTSPE